jgi:hypothetical protein
MSQGSAADFKALIDRIEKLEKDMKDLKGENSILKRQIKKLDEDDATNIVNASNVFSPCWNLKEFRIFLDTTLKNEMKEHMEDHCEILVQLR